MHKCAKRECFSSLVFIFQFQRRFLQFLQGSRLRGIQNRCIDDSFTYNVPLKIEQGICSAVRRAVKVGSGVIPASILVHKSSSLYEVCTAPEHRTSPLLLGISLLKLVLANFNWSSDDL